MEKQQIQILTNQIIKELEEAPWSKEWKEGFLSIPRTWMDIENILDAKDLNIEILRDFLAKDVIIIEEVKKAFLNALKREILRDLENNLEQIEKENREI